MTVSSEKKDRNSPGRCLKAIMLQRNLSENKNKYRTLSASLVSSVVKVQLPNELAVHQVFI